MENNLAIVEAYYKAMDEKNSEDLGKYLHPDVQFIGPLAKMTGKEAVLEAAKHLCALLKKITIRARFEAGHDVMLAYDFEFQDPIGKLPAAVLMKVEEALISRIELFYDPRPLFEKRDEIFS